MDGLILDLLVLTIAGVGSLMLLRHLPPTVRDITSGLLTGIFLWAFVFGAMALLVTGPKGEALPRATLLTGVNLWWHRWCYRLVIVVPVLLAALAWIAPRIMGMATRMTRVALAVVAFGGLWIVPELVYLDIHSRQGAASEDIPANAGARQEGRIVWILFDELSYKLALSQPPRGEEFPNLRGLHAQSVSFGNVQPVGNYTDLIIPSIVARRRIRQISSDKDGDLLYPNPAGNGWVRYDPSQTLFSIAGQRGWNPGIVGWHIPYCRIFAGVLSACFSQPADADRLAIEPWVSDPRSVLSYMLALPRSIASRLHSKGATTNVVLNQTVDDYTRLLEQARAALRNEQIRFLFIHLPTPHPRGIYDRRRHHLCACGNYMDNLMLADDTLATLTGDINSSASAARTTLIVSSDHSWRVPLWQIADGWTQEEQQISGGRFDPRPVFMVHFPGQSSGSEVLSPLPQLAEFDIIAGLLRGQIAGPDDIETLVRSSQVTALAQQ